MPVAGRLEPAPVELAKRLERQLPKGWIVSYERASAGANAWIDVTHPGTMVRLPEMPNSRWIDGPVCKESSFAYTIVPYLGDADYRRRRDENIQ